MLRWNLCLFMATAPCSVTQHHWEESGTLLLNILIYLYGLMRFPPSLLQTDHAQLPQSFFIREILQTPNNLSGLCWTLSCLS